jgi:hypothetical protein
MPRQKKSVASDRRFGDRFRRSAMTTNTYEIIKSMKETEGRVSLPKETIKRMRRLAALQHRTAAQFTLRAVEKEMNSFERHLRRIAAKHPRNDENSSI